MMTTELSNYLRANTTLTEIDIGRIESLAINRKLNKNEFILEAGAICRHKVFVARGLLRTFSVTPDGNEHIIQFAAENGWSIDAESYDQQTPSRVSISAVEQSEILMWIKPDFEMLRNTIPSLRIFAEKIIAQNIYQSRQRI